MSVVSARHVTKAFASFSAIDDLSFTIEPGQCFGLLGPNGAGKSTMIKIIYGVIPRSGGELSVLGLDPSVNAKLLRRQLGVVLQEDALDDAMNVRDNMLMFCKFHGLHSQVAKRRVDELLSFMAIESKADAAIATLSGGMKRRLAFVRSLLPEPRLLILDEPTTGLDPAIRQLLWQKILELKKSGTTILLTTHYMDEAEFLCDELVLVDKGRLQAKGSPRALIDEHCPKLIPLVGQGDLVRHANLEDVFLKLTGRNLNV